MGSNNKTPTQDDPNITTTTDWDSGDSEGVDYVYLDTRKPSSPPDKRTAKAKSPRRKRSPKTKSRCHKCVCGATVPSPTADEDVGEETVFELDTDSENDGSHRRNPKRPKSPPAPEPKSPTLGPTTPQSAPESQDKSRKVKKKKSATKKTHHKRSPSPYIEEYPEQATRPAILLREHKVPRRFSTSDAKRAVDTENRSSPTSSARGRSPPAKRLSTASPDKAARPPPKRPLHRRHQLASLQNAEGEHPLVTTLPNRLADNHADGDQTPDFENADPEMSETGPPTPRQNQHGSGTQIPANIARTSAWTKQQPPYSSSWPLNPGFHHPPRQPPQQDLQYDSDDESNHDAPCNGASFGGSTFPRQPRQASFIPDEWQVDEELERERAWEEEQERERARQLERERALQRARELEMERGMDRERAREMERQRAHREFEERQQLEREREERRLHEQQEHERTRSIPHRRRTLPGRLTVGTMDQGPKSVVTELCDIWRGRASDWESPYPSDNEIYSDDDNNDLGHQAYHHSGPSRLMLLDSSPPRESSPSLLPPHGARNHFGLVPLGRPPAPTTRSRSPAPFPGPRLGRTWAGHSSSNMANGFLLLEAGPLTMEPEMMDGDEGGEMFSQGGAAPSAKGWTYPMVNPVSEPPRPSRSVALRRRSMSLDEPPIFCARKTKELLSPKPVRATRFDFDAWGRDRNSRSSLGLGLMS